MTLNRCVTDLKKCKQEVKLGPQSAPLKANRITSKSKALEEI